MPSELGQLPVPQWKRSKFWYDSFVLVARVATLIALILAVIQWQDSKQIIEELSTKFVGRFPDSFPALANFVSGNHRPRHTLDIVVDHASTGQYSASKDAFKQYFDGLETPQQGVKVRLLVYSNIRSLSKAHVQFSEGVFEEDQRKAVEGDQNGRMISYFNRHQDLMKPCAESEFYRNLTLDTFVHMLMHEETSYYQINLNKTGTQIRFSDQDFPFYLWIRDSEEAVFVIQRPEPLKLDESGARVFAVYFSTSDPKLVQTYGKLFEQLWEENNPDKKAAGLQRTIETVSYAPVVCKNP